MNLNTIAVYCASATGFDPIFERQAHKLGESLAKQNISLVYGGAQIGLMGAVANGVLENDGEAYGVIPKFLMRKELEHKGLTKNYVVETMHERKAKMAELADGIIALPGGFGTMEELFEMITWAQLALHQKPIALLNIKLFYNPLMTFIDEMIDKGFVKKEYKGLLIVEEDIDTLLSKMRSYTPLKNDKWFEPKQ